jgi:hypothetical protein
MENQNPLKDNHIRSVYLTKNPSNVSKETRKNLHLK